MVVWIVAGVIVFAALVYLVLVLRALRKRVAVLQAEQGGLRAAVARAQELAQVAQGLQAHADSLRVRAELAQEHIAGAKLTREHIRGMRGK
ncbi:hypothetical protein [Allorhizocola rhizosphaerae]|uniref:hypothetical protein n=1 Tax=Allorhizocola rhizosphaerae TaxID=1872709 RepID=UPI000E3DFDCA|nr:hypothetical protein [Allorhizocola rhizosphaerae]